MFSNSLRKALRFGGVDIVLRTLALFRADERVGYHGVISLFTEPLQGRARSILGSQKHDQSSVAGPDIPALNQVLH